MKKCIISLLVFLIAMPLFGIEKVGTTSFQFLKIPVGVRGIGMGTAQIAGSSDATAVFWNPAGLGWATEREVVFSHINMPADINYDNVAIAYPVSDAIGTFGIRLSVLYMDDMMIRTAENPEGTGKMFTASDMAVGISYSRSITDVFAFGLSFNYIREDLAEYISQSFAFNAGIIYQTAFRSMKLGMTIQNFGPDTAYDGDFLDLRTSAGSSGAPQSREFEKAPLPMTFKVGIMMDAETMFGIDLGETLESSLAADFEHPSDMGERVNSGVELVYNKMFALRGGYLFNYDSQSFTFGFGIKLPVSSYKLAIDYAYADMGNLNDSSSFMNQPHRFSLSFKF